MRLSKLAGSRYKNHPSEAKLISHAFLLRGAYIRQLANGIYSLLPAGLRVARKIERILREEMERIGCQEISMPVVQTGDIWKESGRYDEVGSEMARFKDRTGHDMVLAMTHEEAVVHLCRNDLSSYRQLPLYVYQIQTKFRDEPRSRGGLIRVREFTMKDAYSFSRTYEDMEKFYAECSKAYQRIFARCGIPEVEVVESDTGMMGGKKAHEFMLLTEAGEDTVVKCASCGYIANREVATGKIERFPEKPLEQEKVHTPDMKSIEDVAKFLNVPERKLAKVVFYDSDADGKPVLAMIRGDLEINESKIVKIIKKMPVACSEERIKASGAVPGYASPMGLASDKWRFVIDHTIADSGNLVTGANEENHHVKNFNLTRDLPGVETVDIATIREGDGCTECEGKLEYRRAIEAGNIFQLGTRYSESMGMTYLDENGVEQTPIMGSYGIGVGRLVSSVIEASHDKYGPVWPISIAPWQVHIVALNIENERVKETAEKLYADMQAAGIEVIFDDRNESAGAQFAEADLIGCPFVCVVSQKNLKNDQIEIKPRDKEKEKTFSEPEKVTNIIAGFISAAEAEIEKKADEFN